MNIDKLTKPQLEAEIEKYKGLSNAEGVEIEVPDVFENNAVRAEWLKASRKTYGVPHEVTEEDLTANNGALEAAGIEVGDTILLPEMDADAPAFGEKVCELCGTEMKGPGVTKETPCADCGDDAEKAAAIKAAALPPTPPAADTAPVQRGRQSAAIATASPATQSFHRGIPIIQQRRKVVNGRLYTEIHTSTATYLLSDAEYKSEVTTK